MTKTLRFLAVTALVTVLGAPLAAYTVVLKDGSKLIAQQAPTLNGDQAIIVLQSGTRTSIAAVEVDFERTREANLQQLGSAMILEDGKLESRKIEPEPAQEERLSDLIKQRRERGAANRDPVTRNGAGRERSAAGGRETERTPYRNMPVLEAIQGAFRSQGVDTAKVYQGASEKSLLIEVETNSEAAVFRSIKVAAGALSHVRANISGEIEAFELVLTTASRSRAGEFFMTPEQAAALVDGEIEISNYFVREVRF